MLLFILLLAVFLVLWAAFFASAPALRHTGAYAANRLTRISLRSQRVRQIVTHSARYRDYLPLLIVLLAGFVVTLAAGDAFLDLAELLLDKSPQLQNVDSRVHTWAVSHRTIGSTTFFAVMTALGAPLVLGAIVAAVTVALLLLRRYRWAAYLVITTMGGGVINGELKRYFARSRPALAEMLRQAQGYSFPSGHSMGSAVVFGALSYLAFRALRRWRWKAAALALACTLVAAIAFSRVYLGVHWISDVGAGVAAGTLWVALTTMAYEVVRRIRLLRALRNESSERA